jgi:hypothetical protein
LISLRTAQFYCQIDRQASVSRGRAVYFTCSGLQRRV